ncbi:MAG: hypothetical protein OHK0039_14910 [Bacteroidia bacterium]
MIVSRPVEGITLVRLDSNFGVVSLHPSFLVMSYIDANRLSAGYAVSGTRIYPGYTSATGLSKIGPTGQAQWQRLSSHVAQGDYSGGATIDAQGHVVQTGRMVQPDLYEAVTLMKTDATGWVAWERAYKANRATLVGDVVAMPDGGYLAVASHEDIDLPLWLIQTNADGDSLTGAYIGKNGDLAVSLVPSSNTFIVVARGKTNGKKTVRALKITSALDVLWEKTYYYNNDSMDDRQLTPNIASPTPDGGCTVFSTIDSIWGSEYVEMHLLKIDTDGARQWELSLTHPDAEYPVDIQPLPSGGYVLAARMENTGGGYPVPYSYFARLSDDGTTGLPAPGPPLAVTVQPNPFGATLEIRVAPDYPAPRSATLHDLRGQLIATDQQPVGSDSLRFDTRHLPAGIYFLRVRVGDRVWTGKVVKE